MSDLTSETQTEKKFDPEAFAMNLARAMESSGQALAAYLKPREDAEPKDKPPNELGEVIKTLSAVVEYWLSDKARTTELQIKMGKAYLDLWGSSMRRLAGEPAPPAIEPAPRDKRFSDPEWKSNQFFDFVKQVYLLTTQWAQDLVHDAEGLDPHVRKKAEFYVQQINKFYILDLKPEKSFIKWCVDQGITVFVISWVNPDKSLGAKTFDDYMKEGPLAAMDAIEQATGELKVHTMGYCVGGTLLASTLAWLAEKRRVRVTSATFLAAQVDFSHAGDLLVFVDEGQISALERDMQATGVLEGSKMAMAFNMLRSNDLIWSYVVSNYLKGQPPSAFDLLHWNSDATRMPAANHSYYLRNCYLENRLSTGSMVLDNTLLDLSKVTVPIYNLATREDHIAPADSVPYRSP